MFDQFVESPLDCMLLFLLLSIRNDGGVSPNWTQMEFTLPQTNRNMLIYGSQIQSRNNCNEHCFHNQLLNTRNLAIN